MCPISHEQASKLKQQQQKTFKSFFLLSSLCASALGLRKTGCLAWPRGLLRRRRVGAAAAVSEKLSSARAPQILPSSYSDRGDGRTHNSVGRDGGQTTHTEKKEKSKNCNFFNPPKTRRISLLPRFRARQTGPRGTANTVHAPLPSSGPESGLDFELNFLVRNPREKRDGNFFFPTSIHFTNSQTVSCSCSRDLTVV